MPPDIAPGEDSTNASPEQRFLQYARTGDKAIIQALVMEFADQSYSQARRIIGRDDGAEDAIQDAYVRLVSTAKRYDGSIPFAAWIGRLVSSAAINYRRQLKRRIRLNDPSEGASAMNNAARPEIAEPPEIEALRVALDSLPERYRTPLTLHYFGGLNRNETAQALGASAGTIASQLFRGLELLRAKLARAGFTVTGAGLIAAFASLPTYSASAEFKASLASKIASLEELRAVSREISRRLASAKTTVLSQWLGVVPIAAVAALAAVVAVLMQSNPSSPQNATLNLTSGLIAHWTFDEERGTTALDSSGNGNIGILRNDPTRMPGKIGGALLFDGIDDYVEIPGSTSLNSLKGGMTIAAWVFKRTNSSDWVTIVGRRSGPDYWDLWQLIYNNHSVKDAYGFTITTGRRHDLVGPSSAGDVNRWVHLAGVYDGFEMRFYRDGVLEGSIPCAGKIPDETTSVMIGGGDNGDLGLGDYADAAIDDVRIYDRALSAMEVSALAR